MLRLSMTFAFLLAILPAPVAAKAATYLIDVDGTLHRTTDPRINICGGTADSRIVQREQSASVWGARLCLPAEKPQIVLVPGRCETMGKFPGIIRPMCAFK